MKSLQDLACDALLRSHEATDWSVLPSQLVLDLFPRIAEADAVAALAMCGPHTEDLVLTEQTRFDGAELKALVQRCVSLKRFRGPGARMNDEVLDVLPHTLEAFVVDGVSLQFVTGAAITRLLARLPALRRFHVRSIGGKFPLTFDGLATTHLTALSLRGCAPSEATLVALLRAAPRLVEVDLAGVGSVSNPVLATLLEVSGATLEALSIESCVKVTDHFIVALSGARQCALRYLNIADVPRIRHLEGLLPRTLVSLECSSHVNPPSLPSLPALESLICSFNKHVGPQYWNCDHDHLLTLGLSGCASIDDIALQLIAQHSPHLQTLNVSRCHLITNVGVQSIASCTHLRELSLVDDANVQDISCLAQLRDLRVLLLGGCTLVSDLGPVLRACTQLTVLHAASCNLDDNGIVALLTNYFPPALERLDLSDCKKLGAAAARAICRSCRKLRSLNLYLLQNSGQRMAALLEVQREFPLVRIRGTGEL